MIAGIESLGRMPAVSGAASTTLGSAGSLGAAHTSRTGAADFADTLKELASGVTDSVKRAEAAAIEGVGGKLPVQDVVEAVMAAEQSLQAAIAVRDKAVSAYLEISRMAI